MRTEELSELSPAQHRCYNEILNRIEEAEESLEKIEPSNPPTEPSASSSPKQGDKKNRNDRTAQKRTSTRRIAPSDEDIFSDPDADNSRPKEQQEKMMQEQYERLRRKEAELRKELKARKSSSERLNLLRAIFDELNAARDDDVTFRQAQAIYERIVDLENKRDNLLGGTNSTAPPDSGAFKRMLDELDATIKAYKSKYFLGFPKQSATVLSFKMNPLDSSRTKEDTRDLFTFSTLDGVCKIIEDKQGVSIDENFTSSTCSNSAVVRLKIKPGDNGVGGADVNGTMADKVRSIELSQTGKRGFYYRIPGRAVVSLVMAGRHETEMSRETLSIAQFGTTVSLPSSTGGRRTKYTLELFGSTGGLRNFIMGSDALVNRSNITDITDSASTILETLGERKEARRKASDELSELERRRKILEEKKKIKELEEDLGVIP